MTVSAESHSSNERSTSPESNSIFSDPVLSQVVEDSLVALSQRYHVHLETLRAALGKIDTKSEEYTHLLEHVVTMQRAEALSAEAISMDKDGRERMGSRFIDEGALQRVIQSGDQNEVKKLVGQSFSWRERFSRMFEAPSRATHVVMSEGGTFKDAMRALRDTVRANSKALTAKMLIKAHGSQEQAKVELGQAKEMIYTCLAYTLMHDPNVRAEMRRYAPVESSAKKPQSLLNRLRTLISTSPIRAWGIGPSRGTVEGTPAQQSGHEAHA